MRQLFIFLARVFAPVYFRIAYSALRSGSFPISQGRNQWIMRLMRLAADFNHQQALSVYGHLLHLHGDTQQSKIQGGIYLQRAAEMGDMKAQFQMGRIFENGFAHYFTSNPQRALDYYRKAAEQGHSVAIARLIDVYEDAELGVEADPQQVQYWQEKQQTVVRPGKR